MAANFELHFDNNQCFENICNLNICAIYYIIDNFSRCFQIQIVAGMLISRLYFPYRILSILPAHFIKPSNPLIFEEHEDNYEGNNWQLYYLYNNII